MSGKVHWSPRGCPLAKFVGIVVIAVVTTVVKMITIKLTTKHLLSTFTMCFIFIPLLIAEETEA